jgi:hypothetical protein
VRKLGFLMRVMAGDTDSLSGSVLLALCDNIDRVNLSGERVQRIGGTHVTDDVIKKEAICNLKEVKKTFIEADRKMRAKKCGEKAPMIA